MVCTTVMNQMEVYLMCWFSASSPPPPILIFQVFAEFNRIASMNLEAHFSEALVQHTPRFIELFKSKKGTVGHKLTELM